MNFYHDERTALFLDGADLDATTKALGFHIDFKKLLDLFRRETKLVRATYYALVADHQDYAPVRPLVDWLGYNGYVTVSKPAREDMNGSGHRSLVGSIAVELAVDAVLLSRNLDHVVLFSGSAEFRSLLAALQKSGCRVTVVSSRKADEDGVADELRRQCDQFIELADLREQIELDAPSVPADRRRAKAAPARPRARAQSARGGDDAAN